MDINEFGDTMTAYDRLGDRSMKTSRKRIAVYILIGIILLSLVWLYNEYQIYMLSIVPKFAYKWIPMH